jgi:hypothetical protein
VPCGRQLVGSALWDKVQAHTLHGGHPMSSAKIAEAAADEVWVRYDAKTGQVITVDVLSFSARLREAFGLTLTYTERTDPQRLEALYGLPLRGREENS